MAGKTAADLKERREELVDIMERITDRALRGNRSTTDAEAKELLDARKELRQIDRDGELLAAEYEAQHVVAPDPEYRDSIAHRMGNLHVKSEPQTYEKGSPHSFFADLAARSINHDIAAAERLERGARETAFELEGRAGRGGYERRDLSRVDGVGGDFVPPVWIIDEYAKLARSGRVTANLVRNLQLPGGTDVIKVPRIATGSSTAMQTADNAAVVETDPTTNEVEAPVRTVAGQIDVSLQALEQSPVAFDGLLLADLTGDHNRTVDLQVLNGTGTSGQMKGILQVGSIDTTTYTDATPTLPELYPKLARSVNQVMTTRFAEPNAIVMHPRRWNWVLSQMDASNRPYVVPGTQGAHNALGTSDTVSAEGSVGSMHGLPVFLSPNVPTNLGAGTNEDRIIVGKFDDAILFEGPLRTRVLPEIGSGTLTVRVQLYRYVAFVPDRYVSAWSVVAGTGLIAPTF